jgi:hypothetical protein
MKIAASLKHQLNLVSLLNKPLEYLHCLESIQSALNQPKREFYELLVVNNEGLNSLPKIVNIYDLA